MQLSYHVNIHFVLNVLRGSLKRYRFLLMTFLTILGHNSMLSCSHIFVLSSRAHQPVVQRSNTFFVHIAAELFLEIV